jgi:hypothetical protein
MKPITTMRFDFIKTQTPNAQRPTSNVQASALSVER